MAKAIKLTQYGSLIELQQADQIIHISESLSVTGHYLKRM